MSMLSEKSHLSYCPTFVPYVKVVRKFFLTIFIAFLNFVATLISYKR